MHSERLEILTKWRQAYVLLASAGKMGFERETRDSAEARLLHRVELSAIASLLIQKGVFTQTEFIAQVEIEAEELDKKLQKVFPGFTASPNGLGLRSPEAFSTVQGWQKPYGTGN